MTNSILVDVVHESIGWVIRSRLFFCRKQLAQTGTTQLPCSKLKNIYIFINNDDKKWEQEQDPLKTKIQQKMIASADSPTVTSRSLNLVSIFSSQSRGHFSNIFVEVFGNALIFIFYLSIGPDASASSPRSFVARLVKIVSFFRRWLMGEESESVKKRKRWFKETTEWAEEVYQ